MAKFTPVSRRRTSLHLVMKAYEATSLHTSATVPQHTVITTVDMYRQQRLCCKLVLVNRFTLLCVSKSWIQLFTSVSYISKQLIRQNPSCICDSRLQWISLWNSLFVHANLICMPQSKWHDMKLVIKNSSLLDHDAVLTGNYLPADVVLHHKILESYTPQWEPPNGLCSEVCLQNFPMRK